jgi:putative transposase
VESAGAPSYRGYRVPAEIIGHAVAVSPIPALLPQGRGAPLRARHHRVVRVDPGLVHHVRPLYATQLRRRRPRPGDKWHLDEVFIKVNGVMRYLWRAVDQDGNVLDILVTDKRDTAAAKRLFRKLLKDLQYVPRVIVTDKLRSYSAAHCQVLPLVEHRSSKYLNNRAENSHQPTRQREKAMKNFRSTGAAQRFLAACSRISTLFRPRRHLLTASDYRTEMTERFRLWKTATGMATTA